MTTMKILKYLALISFLFLQFSCSEDIMDDINRDRNNAQEMVVKNLLPDLMLKTAFESTATDIAWYTTVYIEHNAGTWNQSFAADRRVGQESSSLFNNSWNALYDVMNISKSILDATDPDTGTEADNYWCRGIAQVLMAYNLAITTDMWGEVPYEEAFKGNDNLTPKYDKQSDLYPIIFNLLDDGIANLNNTVRTYPDKDLIFGGDTDLWIKVANSLKARYSLRLVNIDEAVYAQDALDALVDGIENNAENFEFSGFVLDLPGANPWGEFWYFRDHLSVSSTIFDYMTDRNDPRMSSYFNTTDPAYIAPIGEADQVQGGYAQSLLTSGWGAFTQNILMLTFHEMKFIEAEAKFRLGDATWTDALQDAIAASFDMYGIADADLYYTNEVEPLLTAGNELQEILTQKYIAFYDREAIEAYNDYRRTGFPEMFNPNNATVGFVHRFPFANSEVSSNSANVPDVSVFEDKVWWAGGEELVQ